MRNVTCVTTTLLSLTGDRKKLIKQNTLSRYFGVHHLQRKGKWSRSRRKIFFLKSGAKMGHGSKRMIRCQTTCTAHTLENCPKSADSNVPLVRYWNAPWSSCYSFIKEKEQKTITFVKLGKFHKFRCYVWGYVWGAYQTPSPGIHPSNSLKKLCAPLIIALFFYCNCRLHYLH